MTEPSVCVCACACTRVSLNGLSRIGICVKVTGMEIGERASEQDVVREKVVEDEGKETEPNRERESERAIQDTLLFFLVF